MTTDTYITTDEERLQIANTIIQQMGGTGRLKAMVGAHSFLATESGVMFQFKGSRKANRCRVTYLPGRDLYRLELLKYTPTRHSHCPVIYEAEDIYFDMLKPIFEQETGLYLSL